MARIPSALSTRLAIACAGAAMLLALLAALASFDHAPARAAGSPAAALSGDANGDGSVNIADASYLLNWLFLGGPDPAPIEAAAAGLPDSGQDRCYNDAGLETPCDNGDFPGQDASHRGGCGGDGRFVENGDGTVTDTCTGLMWQAAQSFGVSAGWQDALLYANELILTADGTWTIFGAEAEAHGGVKHDDWRLPDARELESLIDFGRADPATPPSFRIEPAGHWSSTSFAGDASAAWCINFYDGELRSIAKVAKLQVLAVRDAE
jgi:hypothetical protein